MNLLPANTTKLVSVRKSQRHDVFLPLLAIVCAACYVLRHSLLPNVVTNQYVDLLGPLMIVVLTLTAAYVATSGIGRFNVWVMLLIIATGASFIRCERLDFAVLRWLGWIVLVVALGPINSTALGRQLR